MTWLMPITLYLIPLLHSFRRGTMVAYCQSGLKTQVIEQRQPIDNTSYTNGDSSIFRYVRFE
ncbi:MAG: hypothetical protein CM15mV112_090 [uncultured marine virus]|nr:MAG: hypothetical protein CM15mV112_090 [uncultured marine virus]